MSPNSQGIDTIQLVAKYEVFKKMAENMDLMLHPMVKSHKLYKKLIDEVEADNKARRKKSSFKPIVELIKLPKVNPKDKYLQIVVIRNTPLLFDIATHHKKAKDTYCLIIIAGLHQPTKKISSDAMKIVSKFLKRKSFKVHSADVAKDIKDSSPIDEERIKAFKERFKPYSNSWVVLPQKSLKKETKKKPKSYHTSFYINDIDHRSISKILYYDKYNKAMQNKEDVPFKVRHWKRLEVRLTFDVTKPNSFNFMEYIKSMDFLEDFTDLEEMARNANIKKYSNDYLEYQINSFIDNRFMNNKQSKKQFNLNDSLEHFKESEFRRYVLPI